MEKITSVGHRGLTGQPCRDDHRGGGSYIMRQCGTHTWEAIWFPGHVWAAHDMSRGLVPSIHELDPDEEYALVSGWMNGRRPVTL